MVVKYWIFLCCIQPIQPKLRLFFLLFQGYFQQLRYIVNHLTRLQPAMIKILHIIHGLYQGGSGRALIAIAKYSAKQGDFQHRIVSLAPASPDAIEMAQGLGMNVVNAADKNIVLTEIEKADIVHYHFWNNPGNYEFLQLELPPMRLLIWFHVAGDKPPQIITKELIDYSDFALACSPYTYEHQVFQSLTDRVKLNKTGMVYGATDFERVYGVNPKAHETFNVGYIGHVNLSKMHPNYIAMSAAINVPNVKFILCGGGNVGYLQKQAMQLGGGDRFEFRGFVEDIKSVLEILDVYGYPLREDTYAASELNLQEAMYAGVPPVVFPYGGVKRLVVNNYTGLIVGSELEYSRAVEYLYHHPEERARLGRNAREYAQQIFGAENAAKELNPIYEKLMNWPKQTREWGIPRSSSLLDEVILLEDVLGKPELFAAAKLFVRSLGNTSPEFSVSLNSENIQQLFQAENKIANSSILLGMGEGGILQYRDYYQNDGYLRLWSGLALQQQGRNDRAASEFASAINLGCNHWRVAWYLAKAATQIDNFAVAKQALFIVLEAVPQWEPAQKLLKSLESVLEKTDIVEKLGLRDINLIIFPDWTQPEDDLFPELAKVIKAIATHPDKGQMCLLIDNSNVSDEDADMALSSITMSLLMEEDLEVEDGPEISVIGELSQ
ncbi:MAG: glycosyltransferase family 4 protein, partial [Okeania sp. SIO1H6]|nr:glycosyltransferase family 4 protein [Okeania sp. SIO1H6]